MVIFPAQMQGEGAASEVSSAIRWFNRARNVDVIIVARGGGSIEDLAAFNDEGLARTIAASTIPIISAIGHETDFTICDFVSDLRAPTPSAAAELVIRSRQELDDRLTTLSTHLARALRVRLLEYEKRLDRLARHGAFGGMHTAIARRQQRVDDLVSASPPRKPTSSVSSTAASTLPPPAYAITISAVASPPNIARSTPKSKNWLPPCAHTSCANASASSGSPPMSRDSLPSPSSNADMRWFSMPRAAC